ncbi:ABC transporter ATP-binding protein [Labrys monachus]|uniref:Spermidine/putrescine import ATP-binding protein PotA n=1 Tax=Labrys monachus TaxID=217067 RepID=A0ABU0FNH5_9HYPH|nr:ABC transporter ATP-binding protein [Labrys monachus]MDQ0395927.1 putative spermidine/putrescine transport system ATP-binding protein [Labrys monachus]
MDSFIHFDAVSKSFGTMKVVDGLDFHVGRGEFVSLLGPSGSGKTTLLMMLAGFETPTSGAIHVDGVRVERLPPYKRNMGVVFQSYALFPHMTIAENIAFPLKMRGMGRAERESRVTRALDLVRLGELKARRPAQLSGGQQQRIALARSLVYEPKVVLMDEPLSALDKQLREHMQLEIRELHRTLGLTVIFVTHDQGEALTMSDRVAVLNRGKIEQLDTPSGLYDHPRTRFVAEFIGETNLLEGTLRAHADGLAQVELAQGRVVACRTGAPPAAAGERVMVSVRPERLRLGSDPGAANALPVRIEDDVYHGDHVRLHLDCGGQRLVARTDRRDEARPVGSDAIAGFAPEDCTLVLP